MPKTTPPFRYHKRVIYKYPVYQECQKMTLSGPKMHFQIFYYSLSTLSVFSFHNASCEYEGPTQGHSPTRAHLPIR